MDGVKYDMMKKYMPFLASINSRPLQSEFGYSCACHATMYTGKYIEEHGTWFIWKRGNNSPYKWINYIPGLKYVNFLPLKLVIGKMTRFFSKNSSYPGVPCLVNLPLKYWPLFETTENVMWNDLKYKEDIPNMFSILKENWVKSDIVALHRGTKSNDAFLEESKVDYKNDEFVYYFIGYTDNIMHKYGETAEEPKAYFKKVDEFIRETYNKAKSQNKDVDLIAFSDHGHIDIVEPKININIFFKKYNLKVNKYVNLIESNYARFWFRNNKEKQEVIKVLNDMEEKGLGFILNQAYLDKYHLNVNKKEHGEIVFYLNAPREFTNTIWGFGKSVKSGHGYEPIIPKHFGIFCSTKKISKNVEYVYLTDILPSILENLNIPTEKYCFHGKNILVKNKSK